MWLAQTSLKFGNNRKIRNNTGFICMKTDFCYENHTFSCGVESELRSATIQNCPVVRTVWNGNRNAVTDVLR